MAFQRAFTSGSTQGPLIDAVILSGEMVGREMPHQGWMGVMVCSVPIDFRYMAPAKQRSGLLVERVAKSSPAARAGIRSADVLLRVNDTAVTYDGSLKVALTGRRLGAPVEVVLLRDGRVKTLRVAPDMMA